MDDLTLKRIDMIRKHYYFESCTINDIIDIAVENFWIDLVLAGVIRINPDGTNYDSPVGIINQ